MHNYFFWIVIGGAGGLLWGLNNFFISLGYGKLESVSCFEVLNIWERSFILPMVIAAINDMSASVSLLCIYGIRGKIWRELREKLFSKSGFVLTLAAIIGGPMGQCFYCIGIVKAGVAYTLAITALYPIIGCLFSYIFLKQEITFRMWCGILGAVIGSIIVSYTPFIEKNDIWEGILFSLCAALCWGGEVVLAVLGMQTISTKTAITFRETLSGLILLFSVLYIGGGDFITNIILDIEVFKILFIAGLAAGMSYTFWYATNYNIGCARGMAMNSTFIIWGLIIQKLFGHSMEVSISMLLGGGIILVGVILTVISPEKILRYK